MDAVTRPHVASSPRPPLLSPLLTSVTAVRHPAEMTDLAADADYGDVPQCMPSDNGRSGTTLTHACH
jgi:hypothetical protein